MMRVAFYVTSEHRSAARPSTDQLRKWLTARYHRARAEHRILVPSRNIRTAKRWPPEQTHVFCHRLGPCIAACDAISKLDWAGDGSKRLKSFARAKDRHVAIVEHPPDASIANLDALDLVHVHLVALPLDETRLVDDPPVGDCDLGDPRAEPLLDQKDRRNERERVSRIPPKSRNEPRIAEPQKRPQLGGQPQHRATTLSNEWTRCAGPALRAAIHAERSSCMGLLAFLAERATNCRGHISSPTDRLDARPRRAGGADAEAVVGSVAGSTLLARVRDRIRPSKSPSIADHPAHFVDKSLALAPDHA